METLSKYMITLGQNAREASQFIICILSNESRNKAIISIANQINLNTNQDIRQPIKRTIKKLRKKD